MVSNFMVSLLMCPRRGGCQRAGLLAEMVVEMRQGLDPKGVAPPLSTNAVGPTPLLSVPLPEAAAQVVQRNPGSHDGRSVH